MEIGGQEGWNKNRIGIKSLIFGKNRKEIFMSKKIMLLMLPLVFAVQAQASAFDSLNDQKLQSQAVRLLFQNGAAIDALGEVTGDVRVGEKIMDTVKEIEAHNEEFLNTLGDGGDIENLKSRIAAVDTKCVKQSNAKAAICDLLITYKPLGEKNVQFKVFLNASGDAVTIDQKVVISRGD